jgi:hypothetical protein
MTSTLTQLEFDRLELALQNGKIHWQPSPNKRVLQLAFEEIENLRRALPDVRMAQRNTEALVRAVGWKLTYPKSVKAHRVFTRTFMAAQVELPLMRAAAILGRKANVNGQRADE